MLRENLEVLADTKCIEKKTFIGDPTRLRQIILNLCSNAVKFTESGSIIINILCETGSVAGKELVNISVADTGIGIEGKQLETIFHKFVQADASINRKYGGTGLGLAITKTLTEIMGGTISVESRIDVGSTFKVSLPLKLASKKDVQEASGEVSAKLNKENNFKARILSVEDYAPNVLVAGTFLEEFGYQYEVASNGVEAIKKFEAELKNKLQVATDPSPV